MLLRTLGASLSGALVSNGENGIGVQFQIIVVVVALIAHEVKRSA